MMSSRWPRAAVVVTLLSCWGCTAISEIPRSDYAAAPERHDVRVTTLDGLVYEFDYASFSGDTLIGYRRRDVEGMVDDIATLRIPLDQVRTLSSRRVDWKRTALIGGVGLAGIVAAGLSARSHSSNPNPDAGGGGGGRGP